MGVTYEIVNPDYVLDGAHWLVSVLLRGGTRDRYFGVWCSPEASEGLVEVRVTDYLVTTNQCINEYVFDPEEVLRRMGLDVTKKNRELVIGEHFAEAYWHSSDLADWFIDPDQWSYSENHRGALFDAAEEVSAAVVAAEGLWPSGETDWLDVAAEGGRVLVDVDDAAEFHRPWPLDLSGEDWD